MPLVPLLVRALAIHEKVSGSESSNTVNALYRLANLYLAGSRAILANFPGAEALSNTVAKAEPLLIRALAIREKNSGPEHRDTAYALDQLSNAYFNQRQYAKAEPLRVRALAIYENVSGPEHPDTAYALDRLATLYLAQQQ